MCAVRKRVAKKAITEAAAIESATAPKDEVVAQQSIFTCGFQKHVERIRSAKARADELFDSETLLDVSEASLALVWEMVFDRLCGMSDADISEVGTAAGIVQKLFATDSKRRSCRGGETQSRGISESTLKQIEEKLKLL